MAGQFYQNPFQPIPEPTFAIVNHAPSRHVTACDKKRRYKLSSSKRYARKIAKRILAEHEKGRSYRAIVEQDFPSVKPGTLNRFAKSEGEWIPKNKEILAALGLYKPRLPYPRPSWLYRWYHLTKDERHNVIKSYLERIETKGILEWLNE